MDHDLFVEKLEGETREQGFAPETITDNRTRKNNRLFFNSQLLTDNHVTDFLGSGI